jgi:hypothetical protein
MSYRRYRKKFKHPQAGRHLKITGLHRALAQPHQKYRPYSRTKGGTCDKASECTPFHLSSDRPPENDLKLEAAAQLEKIYRFFYRLVILQSRR